MANPSKRTDKKELPLARVTVFLKGETKRDFFNQIERTNDKEGRLGREIIENHFKEKRSANNGTP